MIRYIRVRNWRAYRELELAFEPGTTFVVAPNGVGKTSLILAMAWGLFGEDSGVSGADSVRAGADHTEVEIHLNLHDQRRMIIHRRSSTDGRTQATFSAEGQPIEEAAANKLLEHSFGVDRRVAASLAMMQGGGHLASAKALDLRDHLYTAFGVGNLLAAQSSVSAIAKAATKAREAFRVAAKETVSNRQDIEGRTLELDARIQEANLARPSLVANLRVGRDNLDAVLAWREFDAQSLARDAEVAQLSDRIRELLGNSAKDVTTDLLENIGADLERRVEELNTEIAEVHAREIAENQALQLLSDSDATCPTCLRPIQRSEVGKATHTHEQSARDAGARVARLRASMSEMRAKLAAIVRLERHLAGLPPVPKRPGSERPDEQQTRQEVTDSEDALRIHDTNVGRLEAERDSLSRTLATELEREQKETKMRSLYRREAIAKAAVVALSAAVQKMTEERIDPLVNEIQWRWKQLFGREGLQLRPDGSIVLITEGRELPWSSLSGAERIWARLVTHLLVLATSTKIQFAWFDEPLEHLDPRARRTVAAALATASKVGGPQQIIVTTYEYSIAQQLAADVPSTSILRVRGSRQG